MGKKKQIRVNWLSMIFFRTYGCKTEGEAGKRFYRWEQMDLLIGNRPGGTKEENAVTTKRIKKSSRKKDMMSKKKIFLSAELEIVPAGKKARDCGLDNRMILAKFYGQDGQSMCIYIPVRNIKSRRGCKNIPAVCWLDKEESRLVREQWYDIPVFRKCS